MAGDGKAGRRVGPFHVGASLGTPGSGLGILYKAWHTETGEPVLLLFPGKEVDWQPEGSWRLQLAFQEEWAAVAVTVEQAPAPPDVVELSNLLVLSAQSVTRLEDNPQLRAHLASRSEASAPAQHPGWTGPSRRRMALAGLALLCLGWWIGTTSRDARFVARSRVAEPSAQALAESEDAEVPELLRTSPEPSATTDGGEKVPLARKMPSTRMKGQKRPPCNTFQVELNDACWYELKGWVSGCDDAYEGPDKRCYMPVVERKSSPTSAEP